MKKKIVFMAVIALHLAGCARSVIEFKKEPLTGDEYCVAKNNLLAVKNSESGELSLKYDKGDSAGKTPIRANLLITQKGREYHINPHEILKLYIDGTPHVITIQSCFQDPIEVREHYSIAMPAGMMNFGTVTEVTVRRVLFFLSREHLSKMVNAKKIGIEISCPETHNPEASQGYPILLDFTSENICLLQEFNVKCVTNFLNQPGANK